MKKIYILLSPDDTCPECSVVKPISAEMMSRANPGTASLEILDTGSDKKIRSRILSDALSEYEEVDYPILYVKGEGVCAMGIAWLGELEEQLKLNKG